MLRTEAFPAVILIAALSGAGCTTRPPPAEAGRPFDFQRDSLAYSNQLYWSYDFSDPDTVEMRPAPDTAPEGGHRCATMARAVRQFFRAARFDPDAARVSDEEYRRLVRSVLGSDPRRREPAQPPSVIPGYPGLRSFSRDHHEIIDAELGGAVGTYLQRGNWRMIFPFAPRQNRAAVEEWLTQLERGQLPVVRIVNFPIIDVNHTLVLYAAEESSLEVRFLAFDPNDANTPLALVFQRAGASFHYPPTSYFRGGTVQAYEVYDGFFF